MIDIQIFWFCLLSCLNDVNGQVVPSRYRVQSITNSNSQIYVPERDPRTNPDEHVSSHSQSQNSEISPNTNHIFVPNNFSPVGIDSNAPLEPINSELSQFYDYLRLINSRTNEDSNQNARGLSNDQPFIQSQVLNQRGLTSLDSHLSTSLSETEPGVLILGQNHQAHNDLELALDQGNLANSTRNYYIPTIQLLNQRNLNENFGEGNMGRALSDRNREILAEEKRNRNLASRIRSLYLSRSNRPALQSSRSVLDEDVRPTTALSAPTMDRRTFVHNIRMTELPNRGVFSMHGNPWTVTFPDHQSLLTFSSTESTINPTSTRHFTDSRENTQGIFLPNRPSRLEYYRSSNNREVESPNLQYSPEWRNFFNDRVVFEDAGSEHVLNSVANPRLPEIQMVTESQHTSLRPTTNQQTSEQPLASNLNSIYSPTQYPRVRSYEYPFITQTISNFYRTSDPLDSQFPRSTQINNPPDSQFPRSTQTISNYYRPTASGFFPSIQTSSVYNIPSTLNQTTPRSGISSRSSNPNYNRTLGLRRHNFVQSRLRQHRDALEGKLRLVDGRTSSEGNVEIFHDNVWGSVCDDEWDKMEGMVVCKSLGFASLDRVTHNSHFGNVRKRYWLDNLFCSGREKNLMECQHDGWGAHDCESDEAAGVFCVEFEPVQEWGNQISNYRRENDVTWASEQINSNPICDKKQVSNEVKISEIRLRGGRVPEEGRVEVRLENSLQWGLICGDGWSIFEAMVVCRQLGFKYAQSAISANFFGGDASMMTIGDVKCRGEERRLSECSLTRRTIFQSDRQFCLGQSPDAEIASVHCVDHLADLIPDHIELSRSLYLEDKQLFYLQCAMEENCVASAAYKLKANNPGWHLNVRRLLRFTARIVNQGDAAFRPFLAKQNWQWHLCHAHYHSMEVFAHYDITDLKGNKIAEGHKASFCLEDNNCLPGAQATYNCTNYGDQGISPGCADTYAANIDCQWIDITSLNPGNYKFKLEINPDFKVSEQTFDNNAANCDFIYTGFSAWLGNCTLHRPGGSDRIC